MGIKYFAAIALLLLVIAGGTCQRVFPESVAENSDGRSAILLNNGERELVLAEMRLFLTSIQQIIKGISENDFKLVAENARKAGKAAQGEVPGSLTAKLPAQFKQSGFDTHSKFDQLALDSEDMEDSNLVLSQLSTLMQNCIACHAEYRIVISGR